MSDELHAGSLGGAAYIVNTVYAVNWSGGMSIGWLGWN